MRMLILPLTLWVAMLALACGEGSGPGLEVRVQTATETPMLTSAPTPAATPAYNRWGQAAVYENGWDNVKSWCDKSPTSLNPFLFLDDERCIEEAMRFDRARSEAIEFFQATGLFLRDFEELGLVDYGRASAPWSNQNRGEDFLLNGSPDTLPLWSLVPPDSIWQYEPSYSEMLERYGYGPGRPYPWKEYGSLVESVQADGGGQRLLFDYPIKECRVCETVGFLRVAFVFDARGQFIDTQILPLVPPRE